MSVKNADSCLKITLTASIGGAHLAPVAFRQLGPYHTNRRIHCARTKINWTFERQSCPSQVQLQKKLFHPVIELV
jgi:hypothetical protein